MCIRDRDTNDRQEGLLLFPDTGIYYEFIPEGQWHDLTPEDVYKRQHQFQKLGFVLGQSSGT